MSVPSQPPADFRNPFRFAQGLEVRNRTALAAMTNGQSNSDGTLGDDELNWLLQRAKGGFGIVFTCAAHVLKDAQGWRGELGIFADIHDRGLTHLATALKAEGALVLAQLFHGGVRCPSALTGVQPLSSSSFELAIPNFERPREATYEDIDRIVNAFGDAALRVEKAGFDGIEIHGANGYLVTQFLSTQTNMRNDKYGGSLKNRARFLIEIVENIRKKVSSQFLLGVRLSPENIGAQQGLDFDETVQVAQWAAEAGLHFIHLSLGDAFKKPEKYPNSEKGVVTRFREALPSQVALMTAGGIWTAEQASRALREGADIVALGKSAIANPAWPNLAINPSYVPDKMPMTRHQFAERGVGTAFADILAMMRLVSEQ